MYVFMEAVILAVTFLFLIYTVCKRLSERQREKGIEPEHWSKHLPFACCVVGGFYFIMCIGIFLIADLTDNEFSFLRPMFYTGISVFWKMELILTVLDEKYEN